MQPERQDNSQRGRQRARHDEFVAIGCGVLLALVAVALILLYLWFW